MKIHRCARCLQHSLFSTGAFWACGSCGYAITQTALLLEYPDAFGVRRSASAGGQARKNSTS